MKPASELRESLIIQTKNIQYLRQHLLDDLEDNDTDRMKKEFREAKIKRLIEGYIRGRSKYLQACKREGCVVEHLSEEP